MNGGDHRGLAATVITALLTLSGLGCVGVVVLHQQQRPPEPALSAVEPLGPPAPRRPTPGLSPRPSPTAPQVVGPVLPASAPVTLAIPAIDVRSPVQRLGLTPEGTLEVPAPGPHYDEAGWYRYSPTPGSLGPAVIVGHLDSARGRSIFFRLGGLKPHDRVLVTRADGSVAVFEVNAVRRYRKNQFPTQLVYGNTNHAALRLITCGGPIDRTSGHHRDNIVVLASLLQGSAQARPTTAAGEASQDAS